MFKIRCSSFYVSFEVFRLFDPMVATRTNFDQSESLGIHKVFEDDDQNPYEFIGFLKMSICTLSFFSWNGSIPIKN